MNIFGMGPLEILLIVVLALIVFGPSKLPEIMAQVGRAIAEFRRATSQLSDEFNRTIQSEINETKAVVEDTRAVLQGTTPAPQPVAAPAPLPPPPVVTEAMPVATGVPSSNGSAGSESMPPLADTSQWSWETTPPTLPSRRSDRTRDELLPPY